MEINSSPDSLFLDTFGQWHSGPPGSRWPLDFSPIEHIRTLEMLNQAITLKPHKTPYLNLGKQQVPYDFEFCADFIVAVEQTRFCRTGGSWHDVEWNEKGLHHTVGQRPVLIFQGHKLGFTHAAWHELLHRYMSQQ